MFSKLKDSSEGYIRTHIELGKKNSANDIVPIFKDNFFDDLLGREVQELMIIGKKRSPVL